jgi:hypothetical protein
MMATELVRTEDINFMFTYIPREKSVEVAEAGDRGLNSGLIDIGIIPFTNHATRAAAKMAGWIVPLFSPRISGVIADSCLSGEFCSRGES